MLQDVFLLELLSAATLRVPDQNLQLVPLLFLVPYVLFRMIAMCNTGQVPTANVLILIVGASSVGGSHRGLRRRCSFALMA